MKLKKPALILAVFILFAASALGQAETSGQVVQVIDGRTLVIETLNKSRYLFQLQYIEFPRADPTFARLVKEHLSKLILNKTVKFEVTAINDEKNFGKIFLNDIDIGQQLLRDGAVWYNENPNQKDDAAYKKMQTLAREEKRGVWNQAPVLSLTWEAEATEQRRKEEQAAEDELKRQTKVLPNSELLATLAAPQMAAPTILSSFKTTTFDSSGVIAFEYDAVKDKSTAFTPTTALQLAKEKKLFNVRYDYPGSLVKKAAGKFYIAVTGEKPAAEVVILTGEGDRFSLGRGIKSETLNAVYLFPMDRTALSKIAADKKAWVRIGIYEAVLDEPFINSIKRLLAAIR